MIKEILIFGLAIIVHEIGHYVGYRIFDFRPDIKIKWWGISIGENVWHQCKPIPAVVISSMGIYYGLFVMFFCCYDSRCECIFFKLFKC